MLTRFGLQSRWQSAVNVLVALSFSLPFVPASPVFSPINPPAALRSGLCLSNKRPLTIREQTGLLECLRKRTGLAELHWDEEGFLVLGNRQDPLGGSATARALISAVVDSADLYVLESHHRSPDLAFARIRAKTDFVNVRTAPESRRTLWSVEIDFEDYAELRGEPDAIKAFDPCLSLLHELAHGIFNFRDSLSADDSLGDCERYINHIRRELRLPERQTYQSVSRYAVSPNGAGRCMLAELSFFRLSERNRIKTLQLSFELENVIGSKAMKARASR